MTWLAWRQLRTSAAATYATLLLLMILLAVTGPALAHLAATAGDGFLSRAQGSAAGSTLYDIGWIAARPASAQRYRHRHGDSPPRAWCHHRECRTGRRGDRD